MYIVTLCVFLSPSVFHFDMKQKLDFIASLFCFCSKMTNENVCAVQLLVKEEEETNNCSNL